MSVMQKDLNKIERLKTEVVEHPDMAMSDTTGFQRDVRVRYSYHWGRYYVHTVICTICGCRNSYPSNAASWRCWTRKERRWRHCTPAFWLVCTNQPFLTVVCLCRQWNASIVIEWGVCVIHALTCESRWSLGRGIPLNLRISLEAGSPRSLVSSNALDESCFHQSSKWNHHMYCRKPGQLVSLPNSRAGHLQARSAVPQGVKVLPAATLESRGPETVQSQPLLLPI